MCGWRGTATILEDDRAIKDGSTDTFGGTVDACRHEWAVMRNQAPNPEHEEAIKTWLIDNNRVRENQDD